MISQKKLIDKIKERIRIWNYTFILTSTIIIIYMIVSSYSELTKDIVFRTAFPVLLILFSLPLGISLGLSIILKLVKEYQEENESAIRKYLIRRKWFKKDSE